jgi:ribonuclease BN (tRNA processing enzyme)
MKAKIKKLQVIGSGAAFDTHRTNSSFLITIEKEDSEEFHILFDSGYNVFSKLKRMEKTDPEIIKKIKYVIISHSDDDHNGSLKSLLYYRYFIHGLSTEIVIFDSKFHIANQEVQGSKYIPAEIHKRWGYYHFEDFMQKEYYLTARFVEMNHHVETYGIIINDAFGNFIAISADTKAMASWERAINKRISDFEKIKLLSFHDFSFWNAPSRQVHACESDCIIEYSTWFMRQTYHYHNDINNLEGRIFNFDSEVDISPEKKESLWHAVMEGESK